jgi:hypothetical protein
MELTNFSHDHVIPLAKMFQSFNRTNTSKSILDLTTSKKHTGNGNFVCLNVIRLPPSKFYQTPLTSSFPEV